MSYWQVQEIEEVDEIAAMQRRLRDVVCWGCRDKGHLQRDCPHRTADMQDDGFDDSNAYAGKSEQVIRITQPITVATRDNIYVVPPQSWGDWSDTKHSKCLLLGGRRLNQLTLIPKPKGSGGARAATAQVGPANKRNDTKRCLPVEASLRPGEAVPW